MPILAKHWTIATRIWFINLCENKKYDISSIDNNSRDGNEFFLSFILLF